MNESLNDKPEDDSGGRLAGSLPPVTLPPALEARVERSLVSAGLLVPARDVSRRKAILTALAAGLVCFAVGLGVGTVRARPSAPPVAVTSNNTPKFALLLYGDAADTVHSASDVEEHVRWARQLAREGHQISGEKLGGYAEPIGTGSTASGAPDALLQGFFVISAANDVEALAIARSSPHFRHGGRVVVRRIEPT